MVVNTCSPYSIQDADFGWWNQIRRRNWKIDNGIAIFSMHIYFHKFVSDNVWPLVFAVMEWHALLLLLASKVVEWNNRWQSLTMTLWLPPLQQYNYGYTAWLFQRFGIWWFIIHAWMVIKHSVRICLASQLAVRNVTSAKVQKRVFYTQCIKLNLISFHIGYVLYWSEILFLWNTTNEIELLSGIYMGIGFTNDPFIFR